MNIGLAAATFAVVIPAELPDKTFISTIVLSSRYRALPVWLGAGAGLVLQALIAVVLGRLLALLPHRTVEGIVAALFLAGAAYLLFIPEKNAEAQGVEIAAEHEAELEESERKPLVRISSVRIAATTFGVVALAEFGDLTQIVIANFTARSKDAVSVFLGAAAAFIAISGAGVLVGRTVARLVPLSLVRRISGLALLGLGIWSVVNVIQG